MNQKNQDEIKYRPQIHFSPRENWMNDPNGMFYYKGKYHLYFQHNPNANVWGPCLLYTSDAADDLSV